MREKTLSHPAVVEVLKPFIIASWNASPAQRLPADIDRVYRESALAGRAANNVWCFVLDRRGKLLGSFPAFPSATPGSLGFSPTRMAWHFASLVTEAVWGKPAALPKGGSAQSIKLPEIKGGVRIFIRSVDLRGRYDGTPLVETVPMADKDWQRFAWPSEARHIEAKDLSQWLEKVYPDSKRGVSPVEKLDRITGRLTLEPAGMDGKHRYALLWGKLQFRVAPYSFPNMLFDTPVARQMRRNATRFEFTGTFEAVLTYPAKSPEVQSIQAELTGTYPWRDHGRGKRNSPLHRLQLYAAIESRPK